MLLKSGTGNQKPGTGNGERESGNECTAVIPIRIQKSISLIPCQDEKQILHCSLIRSVELIEMRWKFDRRSCKSATRS